MQANVEAGARIMYLLSIVLASIRYSIWMPFIDLIYR